MSWQERIKAARYTSPSGKSFDFQYENVSRTTDKKTSEFIFPEKEGAYIQDLGRAGRKFPFIVFFSGADHDTEADDFFEALEEKGVGLLEHPRYGNYYVVPTGSITQRDDLVTEANQSIFNVTFSETIEDVVFPISTTSAQLNLAEALEDFAAAAAADFASAVNLIDNLKKINLQTFMKNWLNLIQNLLNSPLKAFEELYAEFQTSVETIENGIDDIVDTAEDVARLGIEIIKTPAKLKDKITAKIDLFSDMFVEIVEDFGKATESLQNLFFETNKNTMACIAGAAESVLYSSFSSRNEAIETAESIANLLSDLQDFQDEQIENLDIIDTGDSYNNLLKVVSIVSGYLISISFDLPKEKRIILGKNRNIIELCAELYQDLSKLDDIIVNNNLNADEIEILPIGKEIIYYE